MFYFSGYADSADLHIIRGCQFVLISWLMFGESRVWRNGRAFDSGPRSSGFDPRLGQLVFPLSKKINRHC